MEIKNQIFSRKRKPDNFPLNDLNQDLLEKVLSCLPTSSFFRLTSVSKKWKSVTNSATFTRACSDVPRRQPWFLMVPSQPHKTRQTTIFFDSSENNWKLKKNPPFQNLIPVAASGGLICFRNSGAGDLTVANPVTASSRQIPAAAAQQQHTTLAVAMASKPEGFKLVLVSGELPNLAFREYISGDDEWGESVDLRRKSGGGGESDKSAHYFLSKCGNVVSTDIQRSPSKQFSSVFVTDEKGDEVLYFLSSSGTVVSCNLTGRVFFEYPRILPAFSEYSIDLVEVGGEVFVVLLSEFLESASVRVWRWDGGLMTWRQVAAMPPNMSHKFYGKKVDINCAGAGDGNMFVCLSWEEEEMCGSCCCCCVMCNLGGNEWVELPECCGVGGGGGQVNEFVSAFAFEPRIEASVWGATKIN